MRILQLFLLMLLAWPIGMLAENLNTLVVVTKEGETTFFLKDKPQVTFEGTSLKVVSTEGAVSFPLSDVIRFTYGQKDATGIDEMGERKTNLFFEDGTLVISQIKAGATVSIYALDGKLVRQLKPHRSGTYRLSLSELPSGVYLVRTGTLTYKILKP